MEVQPKMSTKSNTPSFYRKALQAIVKEDAEGLAKAKADALASGMSQDAVDAKLLAAGAAYQQRQKASEDLAEIYSRIKESYPGDYDEVLHATFDRRDRVALNKALELLKVEIRYNVRSAKVEASIKGGDWSQFKNNAQSDLIARIGETFSYRTERGPRPLHYGSDTWTLYRDAILHHHEVDPFKVWLESLPEWDGVGRLDHYLTDVFEAELNSLTTWAAQFIVLGPIQRAYQPGCKLDEMPVLVGKQDIGKSALLRSALPWPHQSEWFADGLNLSSDPKTRAESLQGRVIVECGEMAGSNRAELESLKSFITRQDDGSVRLSYRRDPETTLRRCIIVGTTNRRDSLPNDPSGNRRFVPVDLPTSTGPIEPYMEANHVQLWAEALNRYRGGVRAGLPRKLKVEAAAVAELHRNRDELLEDRIEVLTIADGASLAEIAKAVGMLDSEMDGARLNPRDAKRLAAALRNNGWTDYRDSRSRKWRRGLRPLVTLGGSMESTE